MFFDIRPDPNFLNLKGNNLHSIQSDKIFTGYRGIYRSNCKVHGIENSKNCRILMYHIDYPRNHKSFQDKGFNSFVWRFLQQTKFKFLIVIQDLGAKFSKKKKKNRNYLFKIFYYFK